MTAPYCVPLTRWMRVRLWLRGRGWLLQERCVVCGRRSAWFAAWLHHEDGSRTYVGPHCDRGTCQQVLFDKLTGTYGQA